MLLLRAAKKLLPIKGLAAEPAAGNIYETVAWPVRAAGNSIT